MGFPCDAKTLYDGGGAGFATAEGFASDSQRNGMTARSSLTIVLAAGEGTRMRSSVPKVLHPVAGQSLLAHVLGAVPAGQGDSLAVIIGPDHAAVADEVRVLYGGSVKSSNVAELVAESDIDGALVGGASLDADEFAKLCALAAGGPLP